MNQATKTLVNGMEMKRFLTAGILALCLLSSQIAHAQEDRDAKIKAEMVDNYLL